MDKIFNNDTHTLASAIESLKINLSSLAPYVSVTKAPLGNDTIMLTISFDDKSNWSHGYLENSNYFRMRIDDTGLIEQFSCSLYKKGYQFSYENRLDKKFRKTNVKSFDVAIQKIVKYITEVNEKYKMS